MKSKSSKLRVGEWVQVRNKEEILATLDANGQLDGMPFMPEMFAFCGKRFQVYKRAHKTCDTVFPVRGRRVDHAVHLDTRCDGSAHDGCQAGCLIFWKEDWLRRVDSGSLTVAASEAKSHADHPPTSSNVQCREADVWTHTKLHASHGAEPVYVCQATRLPYATRDLEWWDLRQYLEDYSSGNVGLWRIICGGIYFLFLAVSRFRYRLGQPMGRFYDRYHRWWRGSPFPRKNGTIPEGQSTPGGTLDLQPGELVRIKSHEEILKTLNTRNKNRGLYFDAEEVPYCGGIYRVLRRVTRIINDKTGKMLEMKTPCIALDGVVCQSRYSECRLFCPRSIYSYWREIWLERVEPKRSTIHSQMAGPAASDRELASSRRRTT